MLRLAVEAVVGCVISPDKPSCYPGWKAQQQTNRTGSMVAAAAQHRCTRRCSHTFVSVTARVEHCQQLHTRLRRSVGASRAQLVIPSIHQDNVTAAQSSACVPCVRAQGVHCTVQQQNAQEMPQEREQRQSCMWGQTPGHSLCRLQGVPVLTAEFNAVGQVPQQQPGKWLRQAHGMQQAHMQLTNPDSDATTPPLSKEQAHVPRIRNNTACAGTVPVGRSSHKKAPKRKGQCQPCSRLHNLPNQSSLQKRMVSARHWTDAAPLPKQQRRKPCAATYAGLDEPHVVGHARSQGEM